MYGGPCSIEQTRTTGMGVAMTDTRRDTTNRRWLAPVVAGALLFAAATMAGAADRVVLGEYFTNPLT